MKSLLLDMALRTLLAPVAVLPRRWRRRFLQLFVEWEERRGTPADALRFLLSSDDDLARAVNRAAVRYEGGTHPKHRLTRYHDFFVRHIDPGARVLDVGSGKGELSADIAARVEGCEVVGIDLSPENAQRAREACSAPNLRFVAGDALRDVPEGRFDVVVLSNVVEHIEPRVALLRRLAAATEASRFLVRVPLSERHWTVALRKELDLPWFSDPTHRVEYTQEQIERELQDAGLRVTEIELRWGEAWLVCEPAVPAGGKD